MREGGESGVRGKEEWGEGEWEEEEWEEEEWGEGKG